ncbi:MULTISPECIES: TAXI family TRAP transporter solute-binding subunit [Rhodobacterales]|uniref:TAXI family TRAP transporter solute-binding subunit n=1 Tax=Rhodobacterales TaxID=204455 RepID=UPI000C97EC05|nr:TAXI family TRAP transporter solute-binding subunit [Heliomarina baculiformis]MAM24181.1 C4-dicarboxylate ABC transporter substrate-binding protein [Paracoccaceae bacterium]HCQ56758.1 C4-dicarboxylate ABC transporter substrate-binding protein [Sulfitobacter sp.]|tara:strand:- start:945 stop:2090 length:1146 start_codon:yes stop_codon:yes gene_type:complete
MKFKITGIAAACLAIATSTGAQDIDLPDVIAWSAYDTGSAGHAHSIAIGNMMRSKYGSTVRVLPGRNDVSRMTPLKNGTVDYCLCGIASYFAAEGVFLFAAPEWGPQPIRAVLQAVGDYGLGVAVAADAGIDTIADLKGKRVARAVSSPAIDNNMEGLLAFADLTWDDVETVEFSGYVNSLKGILENRVDAAFALTTTTVNYQIESSPRGLKWLETPADQREAWERYTSVTPFVTPHMVSVGPTIDPASPRPMALYPYPILVTETDQDSTEVRNIVAALDEGFDDYKDAAPGANAYAINRQILSWVMPWSDGSVAYFKEKGLWTPEAQANQDKLVNRQDVLAQAWSGFVADAPDGEEEFAAAWMKARAQALEEAGHEVFFR